MPQCTLTKCLAHFQAQCMSLPYIGKQGIYSHSAAILSTYPSFPACCCPVGCVCFCVIWHIVASDYHLPVLFTNWDQVVITAVTYLCESWSMLFGDPWWYCTVLSACFLWTCTRVPVATGRKTIDRKICRESFLKQDSPGSNSLSPVLVRWEVGHTVLWVSLIHYKTSPVEFQAIPVPTGMVSVLACYTP